MQPDHHRQRRPSPPQGRPPLVLLAAVGRVRRRLAWLALERGALRGLLVGLCAACLLLIVRDLIPLRWASSVAPPLALAAAGLGALAALVHALRGPATRMAAARAADRDLGLADRLATALELCREGARGPFAEACIVDAARTAASIDARRVGRREWPRGARLVPPLALLALLLAVLPSLPAHRAYQAVAAALSIDAAPGVDVTGREGAQPDKRQAADLAAREVLRREVAEAPLPRTGESLNLAALFKDTTLSRRQPDAHAFLGGADERLKLLEQPASLPDLRQQPSGSGYQLRLKRMHEMIGAFGSGGLTKKAFMELTDRLRRMGERGGGDDAFRRALKEGMRAFEAGDTGDAVASMQRALDHLLEGSGEAGEESLPPSTSEPGNEWGDDLAARQGGRTGDEDDGSSGRNMGRGEDGQEGSRGSEAGSGGRGKGRQSGQEPPAWAARNDSFVEGALSAGESEAYDSDVQGRGAPGASRLPFMNVFNEYRKQVEEALVKESVPLEAREQVRAYFRALEE
jgi:hypothetical protein